MTSMLASVATAEDAALAAAGGADIVDFDDPTESAVGAGVLAVAGRAETRATLGDPAYDVALLTERARRFRAAGVDGLRLAVDGAMLEALGEPLAALAREGRLIGTLFADERPDFGLLPRLAALGFQGAMLDTRAKGAGRLLDHLDVARLAAFCALARENGLTAGLAGSLEPPDIPRLLLTGADTLGFRGALRKRRARGSGLDARALALVRDLIPRAGGAPIDAEAPDGDLDRVFVRDFGVEAEIGAYGFERGARQRIAFDVDAWVRRANDASDLRAIFSYDVIMDAIRLVVAQGRHDFVEGLAEAVATRVLAHPRVRAVRIAVRKLDVIAGAVGVEITRRREGLAVPR